jgi:hypothetical protein
MAYVDEPPSRPVEAPAVVCPTCGAPAFAEALECPSGHALPLPRPAGHRTVAELAGHAARRARTLEG